ncbi:MAG: hypothetical protein H6970_09105 [Gammaproteobacteria bacterium]|nr:hypothetical protein [Gammaproteobacteria bacterium]
MFIRKPPPHMPDHERERHPSYRRYTRKYRRKQRIVRELWILSGILMLCSPLNVLFALALGTMLLSFTILDETR